MIERYTRERMGMLWSELSIKTMWMQVELAALWAKEQLGMAPTGAYEAARKAEITEEILVVAAEYEKVKDHDLIAFVDAVVERLEEFVRAFFHVGLTSYCVEDTSLALAIQKSIAIILEGLSKLRSALRRRADEHRFTVMVARTHNIHAEPTSFGLKLLGWVDVLDRHIARLKYVRKEIAVGKLSGAVGTYPLPPVVEETACKFLGLRPAKISTQIISRDFLAHYAMTLVGVANSLDRFATEIRHLAGTDVAEVRERAKPGASGSSAMPWKSFLKNPIKSENTCGLARISRGYIIPALECEVVWGERTLENSSAERIYLPDLCTIVDFMLNRFAGVMDKLEVFPKQMTRNLWKTGGMVFGQRVMMKMTEKGMTRKTAYEILEGLCMSMEFGPFVMPDGKNFRDLVYANPVIRQLVTAEELDNCFNPADSLKHINEIFGRFGFKQKKIPVYQMPE